MALFKFRFATLLRLRERAKEEKQWQLQALLQSKRQLEEEIGALEKEIRDAGISLAGREGQVIAAVDLKLISDYAQLADRRRRVKLAALVTLDDNISGKRSELTEAMRAVKLLEQLRRRQRSRFDRDQDIADQKFSDEIAQRKFLSSTGRKKFP